MAANNENILQQILALLKKEFNPSKVYLFGSQVTTKAQRTSDYDLVMILPNYNGDRLQTWEKCRELIRVKLGVQADVFAYSEKDFEKSKKEFSSIAETAFTTGRELPLDAV
jgi:predicted nucleotidyltransferase